MKKFFVVLSIAVASSLMSADGVAIYKSRCFSCHGEKASESALNKSQIIAGWDTTKIITSLTGYKNGEGGTMKAVMKAVVASLSDEDLKLVAKTIASYTSKTVETTNTSYAGMKDAYNKTTDWQKIAWMDKGMDAVKMKLKDSKSAEFRNVYFHRGGDNIPMTCGEVNSKNSFGGKVGFQKFISAGKPELTFLEEEVKANDFNTVWSRYCK